MTEARFAIGIDLGTTHSVLAFAPLHGGQREVFRGSQQTSRSTVSREPLLPSCLYRPLGRLEADIAARASGPASGWSVGQYARERGLELPLRMVASAKSWLVHPHVDRRSPILPWGARATDAEAMLLSPVEASAAILAHFRECWDASFPQAPFVDQDLTLTVPASFDEVARMLTLEAASVASIRPGSIRLLEEPQAAFLDGVHDDALDDMLGATMSGDILVVDIGGGTSDFSLLRATRKDADDRFDIERVAVGEHILLGGDNIDLALAHMLEPELLRSGESKLSPVMFAQLVAYCRRAKELLLGKDAPSEVRIALASQGAKLVGATRSVILTQSRVLDLVFDGFFPNVSISDRPQKKARGAFQAMGLPYATDAAITRHLAAFLAMHLAKDRDPSRRMALLLNGGVFHSSQIHERTVRVVDQLLGNKPLVLTNTDPDVAVARGAVAYAWSLRGLWRRMKSGSPRSYFLGLAGDAQQALCVLPKGAEPSKKFQSKKQKLALTVGRTARFELFATPGYADEDVPEVGDLCSLKGSNFVVFPPLVTLVEASSKKAQGAEVPILVEGAISEVGTLDLDLIETLDDDARYQPRKFRLAFDLRADDAPMSLREAPLSQAIDKRLVEAKEKIASAFARPELHVDVREVKNVQRELERLLGDRSEWSLVRVRTLFDCLRTHANQRKLSLDHERVWWALVGYCMRPGFGEPKDSDRMRWLSGLYQQGLGFAKEPICWRSWWVAWRRCAGGLDSVMQCKLRDVLDPFLDLDMGAGRKKPKGIIAEPFEEVVLLVSSLERVDPLRREMLGNWLIERSWVRADPYLFSAIGKLGARQLTYAGIEQVLLPKVVETWLGHLLRADGRKCTTVAPAIAAIARRTGDRATDIREDVRLAAIQRLTEWGVKDDLIRMVREVVPLDEKERVALFSESLPVGLRLL